MGRVGRRVPEGAGFLRPPLEASGMQRGSGLGGWLGFGYGLSLVVAAGPMSGCGSSTVGEGDYSQKFEKPAVAPTPPPPDKPVSEKNLSPREKRERRAK